MATQKQVNFFNELQSQGRQGGPLTRQVEGDPQNAPVPEMWKAIGELLGSKGDGSVNMSEEYNQTITDEFNTQKENDFAQKETRTTNQRQSDIDAGFDMEWLEDNSSDYGKENPYTTEHKEAMWVSPSGRLIDGIFNDGFRNLDHRNALEDDSSEGIRNAVNQGAIRVLNEYNTIQTSDGTVESLEGEARKQAEYYINELGYEVEEIDV